MVEREYDETRGDVHSTISYMVAMSQKPTRYLCTPPAGTPEFNWKLAPQSVTIYNGRPRLAALSLEKHGFTLQRADTSVTNFYDEEQLRSVYYPEIERLVKDAIGARRVLAFDYNLRSGSKDERRRTGAFPPARFAHADYTTKSAPQRVRDLLPGRERREWLARRYVFINVWRPIKGPVEDEALSVCDASTVDTADLVASDLIYTDRKGEIYNITFNPSHRWYYFRHMEAHEVLVFINFDSHGEKIVPHTAFYDPTAPSAAARRESVEVRTVACF